MIVQIANDVSEQAENRVRELLNDTVAHNPNFSGVDFQIERGDYTCIPGNESYDTAALFAQVRHAIENDAAMDYEDEGMDRS